jgi:benzodiazapine receptor
MDKKNIWVPAFAGIRIRISGDSWRVVFVYGGLHGEYNAGMKKGPAIKIIISLAVTFSAPLIASFIANPGTSDWYANLDKPCFNPPGWVFGPVWTVLYVLMAVSAGLVWQTGLGERKVRIAMGLYLVQLFLNALWTPLFFGLEMPLLAFIDIVLLWAAIILTILAFFRVSKIAAALMLPYLGWTTFAAVLNFCLWYLNR